jgi:dCMP deaminase
MKNSWKTKYLNLAQHFSTWSKDPSSKIGAVTVADDGRVLTQGYNGFPRGIADTPKRLNDRPTKYGLVVHAEMNCIYNAADMGISLRNSSLFVYGLPVCDHCSLGIIQAGIKNVYMRPNYEKLTPTWLASFHNTANNFAEAGVHWEVEVPRLEGSEYLPLHRFT